MNLLQGERIKYGNLMLTVKSVWHGKKGTTYDFIDTDGKRYKRDSDMIHKRFEDGFITFI